MVRVGVGHRQSSVWAAGASGRVGRFAPCSWTYQATKPLMASLLVVPAVLAATLNWSQRVSGMRTPRTG